ncbi:MAG: hypothetical protein ABFR50_00505 [Candidatus Fermentibacteria bacterium]
MILSLIFISTALADTPSDNDIPTLAMMLRGPDLNVSDINIDLLCKLSWLNFDAVNFSGWAANSGGLMSFCDSVGVYFSICPNEIMRYLKAWGNSTYRYWFRNSDELLTSDSCFARSNAAFDSTAAYHFIGDISLAIPDSVSKYIDTEKYHMLSFGITVNNPNTLSDNACAMRIGWIRLEESGE